jgi:hypothetical protein
MVDWKSSSGQDALRADMKEVEAADGTGAIPVLVVAGSGEEDPG